jgi:dTDP-4-amino-4,6-dideoxygalactose transaminase
MLDKRLVVNGGSPVRSRPFPAWPPAPTPEQEAILLEVLHSGRWGAMQGSKVEEFARAFARRQGAHHGVCVANGTLALFIGLKALGVRPGDEVIIPSYTFIGTATAALLAGAIPVLVDVASDTLLVDPQAVEAAITPRTRAIVPVHIAGCPADMDQILTIAHRHELRVLEDAAQAHGAEWRDRPVGALGDMGCFSFQSSKNMSAGEGGAIITNDPELFSAAWSLHNVGRIPNGGWFQHETIGWNLRLTEFQAALLLCQLDALADQMRRRERGAAYLTRRLTAQVEGLSPMVWPPGATTHAWHLYMLWYDPASFGGMAKSKFVEALSAEGIPCLSGYEPLHRVPALVQEIGRLRGTPGKALESCPVAETTAARVIWLRQNVLLGSEEDIEDVVRAVHKIQLAASQQS